MNCFCNVQHSLSNICLPVLTCLLLFQPTPFPVLKIWSSTLDPVSHIKWKIKFQKCRLVVNYFFGALSNCYRVSRKFIPIILEWATRYAWYVKNQNKNRAENVVTNLLGSFVKLLFYIKQFLLQFLNSWA